MLKKLLSLALIAITVFSGSAQKDSKSGTPGSFDTEIAAKVIMQRINKLRAENGLDTLIYEEILSKASIMQAEDMALVGKASLMNTKSSHATTGLRMIASGGTKNAEEIVITLPSVKGKDFAPLTEIADEAIKKWKKEMPIILNPNYVYIGACLRLDATSKKAFISVVFGGLNIYNKGGDKKKRKELKKAKYTKKNKLKEPDKKSCKNCDKFSDYERLLEGIYVENKKIYIKYDDLKGLSKLLKGPNDGLMFDVVQKSQYTKPDYNIVNNNLQHKGIIKKPVGYAALVAKNRALPDTEGEKSNKLDAPLGKFPKKVK